MEKSVFGRMKLEHRFHCVAQFRPSLKRHIGILSRQDKSFVVARCAEEKKRIQSHGTAKIPKKKAFL